MGICAACFCAASAHHLVYDCAGLEPRRRHCTSELLRRSAGELAGNRELAERFSRGLLPHPRGLLPKALGDDTAVIRWFNRPSDGLLRGALFTDGSVYGCALGVPRAGCAIVQVDASGEVVSAAFGAVPGDVCPTQSIADAEDYALAILAMVAVGPAQVYVDRKDTVDTANGSRDAAVGPRHPRAHLWARHFAAFGGGDVEVMKTLWHASAANE